MGLRLKHLVVILAVVLVIAFVPLYRMVTMPRGATLANFKRLNAEMTLEQVQQVMGRGPDHVAGGLTVYIWKGKEGVVEIVFGLKTMGWFYRDSELIAQIPFDPPPPWYVAAARWLGLE